MPRFLVRLSPTCPRGNFGPDSHRWHPVAPERSALRLESRERIATITARHPRAKVLADSILSDTQHSSGVISSLATKIGHLEEVAALWHSAPVRREFSIANF